MPTIDPSARRLDPTRIAEELDRAQSLLTRADNAPKDGRVRGTRWAGEMDGVTDELARAVFDYVDFVSYRGSLSVYGAPARGDYLEGGLGMGFTLRPKHMTDNRIVSLEDIGRGVGEIRDRLTGRLEQSDLPNQDLTRVADRARAAGFGAGEAPGALYGEIYAATERLLEHVSKEAGAKELRLHKETAPLTQDELLQSLDPKSLEYLVADEVLRGAGGSEHWMTFFADAAREIEMRRRAFRLDRGAQETGMVSDTLQQYLLVVGKRAKESEILARVEAAIGKGEP